MKILMIFLFFSGLFNFSENSLKTQMQKESDKIKKVIIESYIEGIHIERSPEKIRKGFHPEFTMLVHKENSIVKVPIEEWIDRVEKDIKANPVKSEKTSYKILIADHTGNASIAKVELYKDGKHVFTDYILLYKFNDGWKMVSKIFNRHK